MKLQKNSQPGTTLLPQAISLSLFLAAVLFPAASGLTIIDACQSLATGGETYTLNQSLSSGSGCISINAIGVTLDCAGFSVATTGTGKPISSLAENSTIANCNATAEGAPALSLENAAGAVVTAGTFFSS